MLDEPLADRLRAKFPDPRDAPWIKLFTEFPDLVPDKLPPVDELPPDVEHSIKLQIGSSLTRKSFHEAFVEKILPHLNP